MVAHPTVLAGAALAGARPPAPAMALRPPTILRLMRQDFVPHLMSELRVADGRTRLDELAVTPGPNGRLRLEQPVHRAFNLVLLDAFCLIPGLPRLDPERLLVAGLVVRRIEADGTVSGWMREGGRVLGWKPLPAEALDAPAPGCFRAYDPAPEHRRARRLGANAGALAKLARQPVPAEFWEENTSPLFPLPPEVVAATGRSLLFGYLPVTSSERVEDQAPPPLAISIADMDARIPVLFAPDRAADDTPPTGGQIQQAEALPANLGDPDQPGGSRARRIAILVRAISWLAQETGVFAGEPAAEPLRTLLSGIALSGGAESNLHALLARGNDVLIARLPDAGTSLPLPSAWPKLTTSQHAQLRAAAHGALAARWARVAPAETRFEGAANRYHVRAFARIAREDDCPPTTVWSTPSPVFTIKPWHESGDALPITVELPAPTLANLEKLKPDIAFKVPPELQQFMDRLNLSDLLDGKAQKRSGITFGMICSFSIPIITICAFIVLQIFLVLFHILFFWLPFIRICIPFPMPASDEQEGGP